MRKRKLLIYITIILISAIMLIYPIKSYADQPGASDAISAMEGVSTGSADDSVVDTMGPILNAAIALIQIVGTGISLIMVSILGIKYIIAAPNDKADVKKQIMPMLIGAVILFAAVNIVQIISNVTFNVIK